MLAVEAEKKLGDFTLNALFASEGGATVQIRGLDPHDLHRGQVRLLRAGQGLLHLAQCGGAVSLDAAAVWTLRVAPLSGGRFLRARL